MRRSSFVAGISSAALGLLFSCTEVHAQVTPEHIARAQAVIQSSISDNGQYIAYAVTAPGDPEKENVPSKVQLYLLNNQTNEHKPYYTGTSVSQIAFRPKKGTITFITRQKDDKTNAVYEIDPNGGEARKLFTFTSNIAGYSWSHDGNKIAFAAIEQATSPKTPLTYKPQFFEEEFGYRNGYIVNLQQDTPPQKLDVEGAVYMMRWSPDDSKLAISVAPTSSVDDSYMAQAVRVADAQTGRVVAHIENEGKLGQIAWSPDGATLALVAGYDLHDPTNGSLFTVPATGGKPSVINPAFPGKYESIQWVNKNSIHFLASEGTGSSLGTIGIDGKNTSYIFKSPDHDISSFDLAPNGAVSFTANTPQHPSELFTIAGKKNSAPVRRTFSNKWLDGLKLGRQEVVRYKARDGQFDIEGMLIYPVDYKEGNPVPLITVVHGGPESHYGNGWLTAYSMPGQMAAAKGYAVFYPNYRGSTGRGTVFTYSSQGDLAGKEFDDVVDGVDYLIGKGIADKKRIGVTGGSYGGYASAWMSTYYSDRFAAAVMFVGISNNISKFGTSDIPNEMYLVHSRKRIWDDWKWQLERSPVYYADRAQTPILIMHGADDPRVHPTQSMELYRHLKVRKPEVPVRLIYYPGEGHGNARSGSRYDYNLRMMQWFDTYLMTGDAKAALPGLDLPE